MINKQEAAFNKLLVAETKIEKLEKERDRFELIAISEKEAIKQLEQEIKRLKLALKRMKEDLMSALLK